MFEFGLRQREASCQWSDGQKPPRWPLAVYITRSESETKLGTLLPKLGSCCASAEFLATWLRNRLQIDLPLACFDDASKVITELFLILFFFKVKRLLTDGRKFVPHRTHCLSFWQEMQQGEGKKCVEVIIFKSRKKRRDRTAAWSSSACLLPPHVRPKT